MLYKFNHGPMQDSNRTLLFFVRKMSQKIRIVPWRNCNFRIYSQQFNFLISIITLEFLNSGLYK